MIAMYHGTEVGNMVAVSSDPLLLNWKKVGDKAVIPMKAPDGRIFPTVCLIRTSGRRAACTTRFQGAGCPMGLAAN